MDDNAHLPRRHGPVDLTMFSRAEMVRYFAWGYLSRRELNQRLRHVEPPGVRRAERRRQVRSAA
jgi:hypothetical protein